VTSRPRLLSRPGVQRMFATNLPEETDDVPDSILEPPFRGASRVRPGSLLQAQGSHAPIAGMPHDGLT
jgi:hypothetical protein